MAVKMVANLKKFADDTKLGHPVQTKNERAELQEALNNLAVWAEKWGIAFNNLRQEYTMNGQQLEIIEEERDIGVTVSRNLKPAQQCLKAARTAQTVMGHCCTYVVMLGDLLAEGKF